ncbi:ArsR/SmtB family transcription factor [Parapedobacter koreensis]|uniref:Transcriptional regulator, ArsR family n=1 Tax=Parapedobacter koreensis TaxID=332977 RepID=A0A1H7T4N6_9SPHI|nr:metalloregulator ArsR/SmtB family transcription factor [Parapedobacter koreensis]SEL79698.1 transcriptional regulator, ArsR family [Parapedobacter koreensis]
MEARRDVFQAIADPTRRAIISMVAREPTNVNAIAERFDVSRQAVSLHLKILAECGLLSMRQQGRERICEARLEKLSEVNEWVEQYRQFWTQKLDALEDYLNSVTDNNLSNDKSVNDENPIRKNNKGERRL